jgi:riboflavin synthase
LLRINAIVRNEKLKSLATAARQIPEPKSFVHVKSLSQCARPPCVDATLTILPCRRNVAVIARHSPERSYTAFDNGFWRLKTDLSMFTGIIHKLAQVLAVKDHPAGRRLSLSTIGADHVPGESIAINGCCLTVAQITDGALYFDVIAETLEKTNLGQLKAGDTVHAERSLRVGDPIDGHFVQGHIDGTGHLIDQTASQREWRLRIEAPANLAKYLVPKGSIAIDGVSLTLADVKQNQFQVALIPTTLSLTTLGKKQPNYQFNLEFDMMSKTVISYLERIRPSADHS